MDRIAVCKLLDAVESLEASERRSALVEAATLMCTHALRPMNSLYSGFEDSLWAHFSEVNDIEGLIDAFKNHLERAAYATDQYHSFLRGMFDKSIKTRQKFYYEMLVDAGIEVEFGSIAFGESAIMFKRMAEKSVHMEHLLVFYSVELFLKVYISLHPKDSPLADEKIEMFYRHFEAAIPLIDRFQRYAKDDSLFTFSASRRMLPLMN